jgi:hypothetical protein
MGKTNLKRIRRFIEMYEKQEEIQVEKITGFVNAKYMVTHKLNDEDRNEYLCKTVTAAGQCVNQLIFDIPMTGNQLTPTE